MHTQVVREPDIRGRGKLAGGMLCGGFRPAATLSSNVVRKIYGPKYVEQTYIASSHLRRTPSGPERTSGAAFLRRRRP